jgi:hypothetical protein
MPSPPASPLDAMVGEMKAMTPKLAKMQEKRVAQDERAVGAAQARENEDRQRMTKAFDATAYSRDAIPPPWNAPKEAADRTTDLWSAFGSPAMVFATLASAFTHQPMVNSLNAGAGVLNAFHAGDQRAYERDFAAWKANTDLAVKRHGMEREAFDDAMKIMDHDQRAGREALMRNAQVFNDKRALFMLQHGWDKELYEMMAERARTGMEMQKQQMEIEKWHTVNEIFNSDPRSKSTDPVQRLLAFNQATAAMAGRMGGGGRAGTEDPKVVGNIIEGIETGKQPPSLTGLYGRSAAVRAGLEEKGFDLSKAQLEWDRARKQIQSLNGPQITKFVGLANSVNGTIDEVRRLSKEMDFSGIPALNSLQLQSYIQTQGNSKNGQLAARYIGAVNTLKEEFANLAQGGYAPTESVWKLAKRQINENYGVKELGASLDEIQRLINYRIQGIPGLSELGPGSENRYIPGREGSSRGDGVRAKEFTFDPSTGELVPH